MQAQTGTARRAAGVAIVAAFATAALGGGTVTAQDTEPAYAGLDKDLTGTTIETAIRIMSRWQKENVLLTEKDGFVIIDPAALDEASAS